MRRWWCALSISPLIVGATWSLYLLFDPDVSGARLAFVPASIDLGSAPVGSRQRFSLAVRNTGGETGFIEDVRASCGCVELDLETTSVEPGSQALLSATIEVRAPGRNRATLQARWGEEVLTSEVLVTGVEALRSLSRSVMLGRFDPSQGAVPVEIPISTGGVPPESLLEVLFELEGDLSGGFEIDAREGDGRWAVIRGRVRRKLPTLYGALEGRLRVSFPALEESFEVRLLADVVPAGRRDFAWPAPRVVFDLSRSASHDLDVGEAFDWFWVDERAAGSAGLEATVRPGEGVLRVAYRPSEADPGGHFLVALTALGKVRFKVLLVENPRPTLSVR